MQLVFVYAILASIAVIANIAAQDIVIRVWEWNHPLLASITFGTAVGLVVKYWLDKRYIFAFCARNALHDGSTFLLYSAMGLVTTAIFWGFEFGFDYLFASKEMRYLGAVLGLSIGYTVKYQLDKHYVFGLAAK
jgi:putative flippase GtrA